MSNILFEIVSEFEEFEIIPSQSPVGLRNFGPKPLVSPYGPHYQMHPELSRSAFGILHHRAAPIYLPVAAAVVGAAWLTEGFDAAVVQNAPEHERSQWWRFWSAGLTGGFSI